MNCRFERIRKTHPLRSELQCGSGRKAKDRTISILPLPGKNQQVGRSVPYSPGLTLRSLSALLPGDPYLFAVLASASKLSPSSRYYCRVYFDEEGSFDVEAFNLVIPRSLLRGG